MNIVFMGTPDFAVPSLDILLKNSYNIAAVITAPDKPRGRGQQVSFTPVKEFAVKHTLPILQPESLKDQQFISQLSSLNPNLFIVVAFKILPKEVYTIPSMGAFNLHASLLPKYRGAAPINWAVINGEKESGVTTFFLQDKVDTGNIILQEHVAISDDMNAGELYEILSSIGAKTVLETVRLIESGKADPKQQDNSFASPAPKIFKETCRINWNQPAKTIHDFVRGLSPYPAAWTVHNGKQIKIFRSKISEVGSQNSEFQVGRIVFDQNKIVVNTSDGSIEILELQLEGKKRMTSEEFLRGYKFMDNEKFD